MKTCIKCNTPKEETEFQKSKKHKSGIENTCRECKNAEARNYFQENKSKFTDRRRTYRHKRKDLINSFKNVPCMDCKIKYPYYVMDFDHRNPEEKEFLISQAGYGVNVNGTKRYIKGSNDVGEEKLLKEIAKCDVVCSNCHRERTHKRRQEKLNNEQAICSV